MPTYGAMKGGLTKSTADDTYLTLALPSQDVSQIPDFLAGLRAGSTNQLSIDASGNLLTTGTLGAGAITGTSFIIGANTLTTSEWAFLDGQDQAIKTTSSPTFGGLTLTGDITATTAGGLDINLGTLAGDDFTIDTSAFVVEGDTGFMGIGTSTPATKLHIVGDLTLESDMFVYQQAADLLENMSACKLLLGWTNVGDANAEPDLSGVTGHTITYTASSSWTTTDQVAKGLAWTLDFDNTNDVVTITDSDDFSFGDSSTDSAFSIGMWVQIIDTAVADILISKWDLTTGLEAREWQIVLNTNETITFNAADESVNVTPNRGTDAALSVAWHFLVITYTPASGSGATFMNGITIYVDGVAVASTATNAGAYVAMENLATAPLVGARIGTAGTLANFFAGDMGQVFITKETLSSADIWQMYIQTRGFYNL